MAGLNFTAETRGQFAALAKVRRQILVNSLHTIRGRMEVVAWIFIFLWLGMGGVGAAIAMGAAAWYFVSRGEPEWIALLLWPAFVFWQLFPVLATAFTETFDFSSLLRFPLTYPAYFLLRLADGFLDMATMVGSLWLAGILIGIGLAEPHLFPWAAIVLLAFGAFNLLLNRMIFAWVEKWLARRRTREILGVVFILFMLSFQMIGPLMGRYGNRAGAGVSRIAPEVSRLERLLPPGLAAAAVARPARGESAAAFAAFVSVCCYGAAVLWPLHLRLRAQYLGENLSEGVARTSGREATKREASRVGWGARWFSGPVATITEKELHYLIRSGPMLLTLIMPVFVLIIFSVTPAAPGVGGGLLSKVPGMAFPIGTAYALLILTNLVYNSFGADGGGVQLFFVLPIRFRTILMAKNLAHASVLAIETVLVWVTVCLIFRPPAWDVTLATLAGILFALPVNLAAGNLLSIQSPKKVDYGVFGRQRATGMTVLTSFAVQIGVFGLAAAILLASRHYGRTWIATILFLALAAIAFTGYRVLLNRADRMALDRREIMISELCRS